MRWGAGVPSGDEARFLQSSQAPYDPCPFSRAGFAYSLEASTRAAACVPRSGRAQSRLDRLRGDTLSRTSRTTQGSLGRRWASAATIAIAIAAVLVPSHVSAAAATPAPHADILAGSANGGNGKLTSTLLPTLSIGKIATQYMPCLPDSGQTYTNKVATVKAKNPLGSSLLALLTAGAVVNQGTATFDDSSAAVTEKSSLATVRLLTQQNGISIVSADAITATATLTENTAGAFSYVGSTSVLNLRINGVTIASLNPAPNTVLSLGTIGSVTLNEQIVHPTVHSFTVNAVHVHINNLLGYHGDIYLGQATTRVAASTSRLTATAYELSVTAAVAGTSVGVGRQNLLALACTGSDGIESSQAGVGISVSGVASAAAPVSKVNGNRLPLGAASTYAVAQVGALNLLSGRITADAIVSRSNTAQHAPDAAGKTVHSDAAGTQFVNLKVDLDGNGVPEVVLNGAVAPNTQLSLAGVGTLILNRQLCEPDSGTQRLAAACDGVHQSRFTVTAVYLKIAVAVAGLSVGTLVRVAEAQSGVSA